jgi:hypothetical protein
MALRVPRAMKAERAGFVRRFFTSADTFCICVPKLSCSKDLVLCVWSQPWSWILTCCHLICPTGTNGKTVHDVVRESRRLVRSAPFNLAGGRGECFGHQDVHCAAVFRSDFVRPDRPITKCGVRSAIQSAADFVRAAARRFQDPIPKLSECNHRPSQLGKAMEQERVKLVAGHASAEVLQEADGALDDLAVVKPPQPAAVLSCEVIATHEVCRD